MFCKVGQNTTVVASRSCTRLKKPCVCMYRASKHGSSDEEGREELSAAAAQNAFPRRRGAKAAAAAALAASSRSRAANLGLGKHLRHDGREKKKGQSTMASERAASASTLTTGIEAFRKVRRRSGNDLFYTTWRPSKF